MTLNTFVAGNPGSIRGLADSVRRLGTGVDETASGWHRTCGKAAGAWEGQASDAFQNTAKRNGNDADALARLHTTLAGAATVLADELDTVTTRMEQARQVARDGKLTVLAHAIMPPKPFTATRPELPPGRSSAAESTAHAEATAQFEADQALHAKQQAAFNEAQATVDDARNIEKAAHETLKAALDRIPAELGQLGQSGEWTKAAAAPTNPAATALAGAAASMETHALNATRTMFEHALTAGPFQTRAVWASMSAAQRADMTSRYPQMVGSADGVPASDRHTANLRQLDSQRQELVSKLQDAKTRLRASYKQRGGPNELYEREVDELNEAIAGIDAVKTEVSQEGRFLLGLDAPANGRGQVIIASGNPDTAQNVSTMVPGTYSDLGDAMNYVHSNESITARASELAPGQSFASVTWVDYESPKSLVNATEGRFAENASGDLSKFQEGLRASHEGHLPPSNNTVIGHSYGSTTVGYAARDHAIHSDNIVFIGSPGVGVDQAQDLGVPPENVWSGTGNADVIDYVTPSPNPLDYSDIRDDPHWFGRNPSNDLFGARDLPVSPWGSHGSYWTDPESVDGMARVVSGTAPPPPAK